MFVPCCRISKYLGSCIPPPPTSTYIITVPNIDFFCSFEEEKTCSGVSCCHSNIDKWSKPLENDLLFQNWKGCRYNFSFSEIEKSMWDYYLEKKMYSSPQCCAVNGEQACMYIFLKNSCNFLDCISFFLHLKYCSWGSILKWCLAIAEGYWNLQNSMRQIQNTRKFDLDQFWVSHYILTILAKATIYYTIT